MWRFRVQWNDLSLIYSQSPEHVVLGGVRKHSQNRLTGGKRLGTEVIALLGYVAFPEVFGVFLHYEIYFYVQIFG